MYIMEVNIRPSLRKKYATVPQKDIDPATTTKSERMANVRRDERIIKEMWFMVIYGLSIFLGGFGIWALDIKYCSQLRKWRHDVGLPWGLLSEAHGWWKVFTPYSPFSELTERQAFDDRNWVILLYCLGHLAASLLE